MANKERKLALIVLIASLFVFVSSLMFLMFGRELAMIVDEMATRVTAIFISFASFCSTSAFSYLVYKNNKNASRINDDLNKRAELFRELQFASNNYSIIEFKDKMNIYVESNRYIQKYLGRNNLSYHIFEEGIDYQDVLKNTNKYLFFSLKVPFVVVEGKVVSSIKIEKLKFERNGRDYYFVSHDESGETIAFILYDEYTKQRQMIINLIVDKDIDFFDEQNINEFSKLKINIKITSLLGVEVKGVSELYFTNPESNEHSGINSYWINASNFKLTEMPTISKLHQL